MRVLKFATLAALAAIIYGCASQRVSDITIDYLRCEYLVNPLGIDEVKPRLSWLLESPGRGVTQSAYRILVSSSAENLANNMGDLWDSGKVVSDRMNQVVYDGQALDSRMECYWKVCVWDADGSASVFSETAKWTMGLLGNSDWQAEWIAMESGTPEPVPKNAEKIPGPAPPWFRTEFAIGKNVTRATLYATARGVYELHINGERVNDDVLSPGWTDFRKRIHYLTYDVTSLLKSGGNAVGAVVGDGWHSGFVGWLPERGFYGKRNSLLMQLEIEYEDGSSDIIKTDDSWKCSEGPILTSDMLMGEVYDARKDLTGWSDIGFDDSGWQTVVQAEPTDAILMALPAEPIKVTDHIKPLAVTEPSKGVYVFDLGRNFAGWIRLNVTGEPGTEITIRYAEFLNPDGTMYTENLRSAKSMDTYILKGEGEEVFEPRFTFHGFQYVELTGFPGRPDKNAITGCVINSAMPPSGTFESSNPLVNKMWVNSTVSQRANFISIPTDCPQRDERMGWTGDAQIFVGTAAYNMDVAAFFTKWMDDVEDTQPSNGAFPDVVPLFSNGGDFEGAPGWSDAGIIVPWTMYRVYGDTRIIERHFDAMERWMDHLLEGNPDMIRRNKSGANYGDWLSINADTPKDLMATAFWAYDARLMAEMAGAIRRRDDARKYTKLFEDIRSAFQESYVSSSGEVYPLAGPEEKKGAYPVGHTYVPTRGDTQTAYLLALYMNLIPDDLREQSAMNLVEKIREKDWHLSTGFLGVRHLNPVLTMTGHNDVAYRLLNTETFPSWLYPVKNGATSIWERWDGWTEEKGFQDPGMNSFNHYSYGSICEWLFRSVAGIDCDPEVPGFKNIVIRPYPGEGLTYANAEYNSINGKITSGWSTDDHIFTLNVTIPANTRATVYVPTVGGTQVMESGAPAEEAEGVKQIESGGDYTAYRIGSGDYHFTSVYSD